MIQVYKQFQEAVANKAYGTACELAEKMSDEKVLYAEALNFLVKYSPVGALRVAFKQGDLSAVRSLYQNKNIWGGTPIEDLGNSDYPNVVLALKIARSVHNKKVEKEIYRKNIELLTRECAGEKATLENLINATQLADFEEDSETKEMILKQSLDLTEKYMLGYQELTTKAAVLAEAWKQIGETIKLDGLGGKNLEEAMADKKRVSETIAYELIKHRTY